MKTLGFLVCAVLGFASTAYGCGRPCTADSKECCVRQGCGCVDTLGSDAGCDAPCTVDCRRTGCADKQTYCAPTFVDNTCNGPHECVKYAGVGESCGGHTPFPCITGRCAPGTKCFTPVGLFDGPGQCRKEIPEGGVCRLSGTFQGEDLGNLCVGGTTCRETPDFGKDGTIVHKCLPSGPCCLAEPACPPGYAVAGKTQCKDKWSFLRGSCMHVHGCCTHQTCKKQHCAITGCKDQPGTYCPYNSRCRTGPHECTPFVPHGGKCDACRKCAPGTKCNKRYGNVCTPIAIF